MGSAKLEEILASRKPASEEPDPRQCFSLPAVGSVQENYLELRFRNGLHTCFNFNGLSWFNYDPEPGIIDMEFDGFLVTIKGRGLYPALFNALKNRQVAWVREADSKFQDSDKFDHYVESIDVVAPPEFNKTPD